MGWLGFDGVGCENWKKGIRDGDEEWKWRLMGLHITCLRTRASERFCFTCLLPLAYENLIQIDDILKRY